MPWVSPALSHLASVSPWPLCPPGSSHWHFLRTSILLHCVPGTVLGSGTAVMDGLDESSQDLSVHIWPLHQILAKVPPNNSSSHTRSFQAGTWVQRTTLFWNIWGSGLNLNMSGKDVEEPWGFHKEVDDFAVIKESKGGVTARASLNETLMNKFPQLRTTMGEEPVRPRKQSMPLMKHCWWNFPLVL